MVFGILLGDILFFAAGLVVGWMVLPQPTWLKKAWKNVFG